VVSLAWGGKKGKRRGTLGLTALRIVKKKGKGNPSFQVLARGGGTLQGGGERGKKSVFLPGKRGKNALGGGGKDTPGRMISLPPMKCSQNGWMGGKSGNTLSKKGKGTAPRMGGGKGKKRSSCPYSPREKTKASSPFCLRKGKRGKKNGPKFAGIGRGKGSAF